MLTKSIRLNREDAIGVEEMIQHDPRIEKGRSEALFYAYKDAAEDILAEKLKWSDVSKTKFEDDPNNEIDYADIMTFSIEEEDFNVVVESLRSQLGITKVRISYMTRLCIVYARMRLNKEAASEKDETEIQVKNIDGVALIQKLASLLQSSNEGDREIVKQISKILEV